MTTDVDSPLSCWCGNDALVGFDGPYRRCDACQTLVAPPPMDHADVRVGRDEAGYYGREYWFGHQQADLGLPDLASRARTDVPERCLHWLKTLLRVLLPPAKVLEIGSGHGGFVALLRQAGFDATGLELSPWVVDFARKTFDVPMLHGPVEDQPIPPGTFDAIVMMDVLEHLPRPLATMEKCLSLLKPNGLLVVQTPCYPENTSIAQFHATGHKFPLMLDPSEHLFLYSQSSVRQLFTRLGASCVEFVPAIFHFYDMALLAGRSPIHLLEPTDAADCLLATPVGRMVQAMIDLDDRRLALLEKYRAAIAGNTDGPAPFCGLDDSHHVSSDKTHAIAVAGPIYPRHSRPQSKPKGSSVNTVIAPPSSKPSADWKSLTLLQHQFTANVAALAGRDAKLADRLRAFAPIHQLHVSADGNAVLLGRRIGEEIEVIPELVSASVAAEAVKQLCPAGGLTQPALVAGIDRGWLWQRLYAVPSAAAGIPGHRLPLFFLEKQIDRIWTALHLHDWRTMLADPRVRLFVGEDSYDQFRRSLLEQPTIPWPRQSITVDPSIWPTGKSLDHTLGAATLSASQLIESNRREMAAYYAGKTPGAIAEQLRSGMPLRVLGITSRYTTFLQYSMRDWLAAFERMGHTTQLLIESLDHEHLGPIRPGQACAEFRPDLILIIDHYRREFPSLPVEVPCVMWVQDQMQHLFSPAGGAAQDILDYCLGFARLRMVSEFKYPANRYMPAHVGVDETRYSPRKLSADQQQRFGCDISFVSHASMPAKAIVEQESARQQLPDARKMLHDIFDRLSAIYAAGGIVCEEPVISAMIDQGLADHKLAVAPETKRSLLHFFHQRVNNALFRHQPLEWLAEMGVDLRLWGRGWESHPTLSRFARGPADNQTQLGAIYQASRINLHMSPHGAVHQRIFEGLAAGGFFLLRHCPGDELERHFRKIIGWCEASGVISDPELLRCATRDIRKELSAVANSLQSDPFKMPAVPFMDVLRASEQAGYIRSAGMIWGSDYDAVAFGNSEELTEKVRHFLASESDRQLIAERMRRPVLKRFTYTAVSRRLMEFIAADLSRACEARAAA